MRLLFSICLLVILLGQSFDALAQDSATESFSEIGIESAAEDTLWIPFVAYWSVGDVYNFRLTKIQDRDNNGEISRDSVSWMASFEVIDSTASSYDIKWTSNTAAFDTRGVLPDSLLDKISTLLSSEYMYRTDEYGAFKELLDWEELSAKMAESIDFVMDAIRESSDTPLGEQYEQMMAELSSVTKSKEFVESKLLEDIQLLHWPLGSALNASHETPYEDSIPSLLDGTPMKTEGVIGFEYVDQESAYAEFYNRKKVDSEDALKVVTAMFKKMGVADEEFEAEMDNAKFDMTDDFEFQYFYDPGIPQRISYTRTIDVSGPGERSRRMDTKILEMLFEEDLESESK